MRRVRLAAIALGLLTAGARDAAAQIVPTDIAESAFFSESFARSIQDALNGVGAAGDREHPITKQGPFGSLVLFQRGSDPFLVVTGSKVDFGAEVVLPSDALVLKEWVAVFSRTDVTLSPADFPAQVQELLQRFWPNGAITLYKKGFVLRAEPDGTLLQDVRTFFSVDQVDGKTVLGFAKSATRNTTGIMLFGTVRNPFRMEMTLTNPELSFTKKAGKPNPTIAVATVADIAAHRYDLMVEASKKVPDTFVLKTASLNPQDVINISKALSAPVFGIVPASRAVWNVGVLPSFSLRPPTTTSPNMPVDDPSKVVVYAAVADKPEWKVTGPAIRIRGSLQVDLLPAKPTIGIAEVAVDRESMAMDFAVPRFTLPNSDLAFGSASASITGSSDATSMRVSAASGNACFNQTFVFRVDQTGMPKADWSSMPGMQQLDPKSFANRLQGCANDATQTAKWALQTGTAVFGFAQDKMIEAATPVFGAQLAATAAKLLGYPISAVGAGLGKALSSTELMNVAEKVYGLAQVGAVAKAAGLGADAVINWTQAAGRPVADAAAALAKAGFANTSVLNVARTILPLDQLGAFAKGLGTSAAGFVTWSQQAGLGTVDLGKMLRKADFPSSDVLSAVYAHLPKTEFSFIAQSASYSAETVLTWTKKAGLSPQDAGALIDQSFFGSNDIISAADKVFGSASMPAVAKSAAISAAKLCDWKKMRILEKIGPGPKAISDMLPDYWIWHDKYMQGIEDFGKTLQGTFPREGLLNSARLGFDLSYGGVASFGRATGYAAGEITSFFKSQGVTPDDIGKVLRLGGFPEKEAINAISTVYDVGSDEARRLWSGAEAAGKKACKTLLGWTKLC